MDAFMTTYAFAQNGQLPAAGGTLDQAATWLRAYLIVQQELGRIRELKAKEARRG